MAGAVGRIAETSAHSIDLERKPPLTSLQILMMNVGFFGIQFSFGLQQTAINPLFALIGADPHSLPLLNLAGPVTGLLVQPMIGAMSDRTWHPKWGRRSPYFLVGAIGCSITLFLYPWVTALWMAVVFLWLLDISNNTAMEPYRAFISDRLPKSQLARGFLTQSLFVGAGAVTANVSLFVFQKLIQGGTAAGVPYWVFGAFWVGAVCSIGSVLISVLSTREIPPTEDELAELRAKPKGFGPALNEIVHAVRDMPAGMHKIGLVFAFQWYAMFIYWQFVSLSIAKTVWGVGPKDPLYSEAAAWTGLVNGSYNLITVFAALMLIRMCTKFGAKRVHAGALLLAAVGLYAFTHIGNRYLLFVPMIGLGIAWASMMGVPYVMVSSMVPKERSGVYMGIVNMMIVIPMLIETITFGWIYEHLLGASPTNALIMSGALLACGAIAMLWVSEPDEAEESPLIPLGTHRHISVYDRVVVGTDGTSGSLHAVAHAAGVATAADAHLIVVSAYNPGEPPGPTVQVVRRELYGEEAARDALRESVTPLIKEKALRVIDQRVVAGDPAKALLEIAGDDSACLIVVGNRGLGSARGEHLGSVPREIAQNALCDVLVVQATSVLPIEAKKK
jgi:maltose/moltooligosaccharide transporter